MHCYCVYFCSSIAVLCYLCCSQAVVRAAINGHLLILEGIEKAERNVLPVLNNLLENREAQLDDGRFIVSHERYDQLAAVSHCMFMYIIIVHVPNLYLLSFIGAFG